MFEIFLEVWGVFPGLLLANDYAGHHTQNMALKASPHRTVILMATLLFAVAFCGHANAALHLGIDDAVSSCVPIAGPSTADDDVEQSSGELGIALLDAGNSNPTSQCIGPETRIATRGEGVLVRRPESKVNSRLYRDPLDQVPRR
jgi:hypothetical protein